MKLTEFYKLLLTNPVILSLISILKSLIMKRKLYKYEHVSNTTIHQSLKQKKEKVVYIINRTYIHSYTKLMLLYIK